MDYPQKGSIKSVETSGESMLGFVEGMGVFKQTALKYLSDYGISHPQKGKWYPLEPLISLFNKISNEGGINTLRIIGASVIKNAKWPEDIDSLGKALNSVDKAYHINHRRNGRELFDTKNGKIIEGFIGHDIVISPKKNENKALYICGSFYPCEFDFGMASAFVNKFKPKGCNHYAKIRHDIGECRSRGGETCTYIIEW